MKSYRVTGSIPKGSKGNDRRWAANVTITVLAPTLQIAVARVVEEYPDIKIDSAKHLGDQVLLVAKESE
jgi:hypothetical protein